jgi:hypothetical protein
MLLELAIGGSSRCSSGGPLLGGGLPDELLMDTHRNSGKHNAA